ncbi:MAG: tetratricopeptide repeat protein [Bacteroidales bacterium]
MSKIITGFFVFIFVASIHLSAQNSSLDSFLMANRNKHDTVKIQLLLNEYFAKYRRGIVLDGKECLEKALEIAENCDSLWWKGTVLIKFGDYYKITGDYEKAVDYYFQAQKIFTDLKKFKALGSVYNNLGATYENMGKYDEGMSNLIKALDIYESVDDSLSIAKTYLNLGLLYFRQEEYDKSIELYNESLKIRRLINDQEGIALLYNNIAIVNYYTENYDNVRSYFQKAYEIYVDLGNRRSQVMALSNLAEIYKILGQKDQSLESYLKVLELEKELGEKGNMAKTYFLIGDLYYSRNNLSKAKKFFLQALDLSKEVHSIADIKDSYFLLSGISEQEGDYKTALAYFEQYHNYNDSLFNAEKSRQIQEIETQYETRKKEQRIENLENEKIIRDLRIKRQQFFLYSVIMGFIVIAGFLLLLFNKNKKIRLASNKLAYQKKQITDSIEYASRIQNAILPPPNYITQLIPEHFILFHPRDIVSGDFYWITKKAGKIFIAVVDCTGHGVPGAFMSMLGYSFLNEIVNKGGDLKANTILNQLRNQVKESLHQTGKNDDTKDGMDISLCIIDKANEKLQFAGAYNSLFFISSDKPATIKGDRMPIGIYLKEKKTFTNHEIKIHQGDIFYLFTDGYVDQFGGKTKKKFRILPFKELLISVHKKPVHEQKTVLENTFLDWKGDLEQIDDILVFGFRI